MNAEMVAKQLPLSKVQPNILFTYSCPRLGRSQFSVLFSVWLDGHGLPPMPVSVAPVVGFLT